MGLDSWAHLRAGVGRTFARRKRLPPNRFPRAPHGARQPRVPGGRRFHVAPEKYPKFLMNFGGAPGIELWRAINHKLAMSRDFRPEGSISGNLLARAVLSESTGVAHALPRPGRHFGDASRGSVAKHGRFLGRRRDA